MRRGPTHGEGSRERGRDVGSNRSSIDRAPARTPTRGSERSSRSVPSPSSSSSGSSTRPRSPILFLGLVLGSLSALVAMGLVLVYRANRIVNFAQGDLGARRRASSPPRSSSARSWPFFVARRSSASLAALVARRWSSRSVIIRRFAKAPRLDAHRRDDRHLPAARRRRSSACRSCSTSTSRRSRRCRSTSRFEWVPVVVPRRPPADPHRRAARRRRARRCSSAAPRVGIAIRAVGRVGRPRRAARHPGQAHQHARVGRWPAGLSGRRRAPAPADPGRADRRRRSARSLLLRALAAAVIGRMESLPRTFAAALVLGMIEQAVLFETGRTIVVDAVLFAVIIGALLLQRRGGEVAGPRHRRRRRGPSIREVRPIPRELVRLPEVRVGRRRCSAALGAVAPAVRPARAGARSQVNLFSVGLIFAMIIAVARDPHRLGRPDQPRPAARSSPSARPSPARSRQQGKDFFVCLARRRPRRRGRVAVAIGIPALRIQGPFLAVTTLAFARRDGHVLPQRGVLPVARPRGRASGSLRPVLFDKFDLESEHTYYYVVLLSRSRSRSRVGAVDCAQSRTGRALVATRDNTRAAQSYGISPTARAAHRVRARPASSPASPAALYVFHQHGVSDTVLDAGEQPQAVLASPSSAASARCPARCSAPPTSRSSTTRRSRASRCRGCFASGVGVLLILLVLPGGLGGVVYDVRDALLRRVARAARHRRAEPARRRPRSRTSDEHRARRGDADVVARARASRAERRPAAARARPRGVATARRRCSSASTSTSSGARSSRCSARTAPASRRCSSAISGLVEAERRHRHLRRRRHHRHGAERDGRATASCSCPAARACSRR